MIMYTHNKGGFIDRTKSFICEEFKNAPERRRRNDSVTSDEVISLDKGNNSISSSCKLSEEKFEEYVIACQCAWRCRMARVMVWCVIIY